MSLNLKTLPQVEFEQITLYIIDSMLEKTVKWYLENQDWLR